MTPERLYIASDIRPTSANLKICREICREIDSDGSDGLRAWFYDRDCGMPRLTIVFVWSDDNTRYTRYEITRQLEAALVRRGLVTAASAASA